MHPDDLDRALEQLLHERREQQQFRRRIEIDPIDSTHVRIGQQLFTNFASNNYLGLTHHPRIRAAIEDALTLGVGSGAAGLISGYTDLHRIAEQTLARWKQTQAAVLLPSGYQANLAAVQTLASCGSSVRFLLDKLVHASLIDAVRATGAEMRIFPHNHLEKLRRLLQDAPPEQMQVVLTESIFSMDGDTADLRGLAELKHELPFVLLLDEAHGSGVYGPNGSGYAADCGLQKIVDVAIVTLSKALGCVGGAVCGSQKFCDALMNVGRAYIYSTSVPPMIAAAAQRAIEICHDEPQRQQRVRALARRVREILSSVGFSVPPGDSPIIPLILGEESAALAVAESLREAGLLVVAVRPPTVPRGSSRLRITLSCDHSDDDIDALLDAIKKVQRLPH
jgi:8-amino-7-oxononanoate synthase